MEEKGPDVRKAWEILAEILGERAGTVIEIKGLKERKQKNLALSTTQNTNYSV